MIKGVKVEPVCRFRDSPYTCREAGLWCYAIEVNQQRAWSQTALSSEAGSATS